MAVARVLVTRMAVARMLAAQRKDVRGDRSARERDRGRAALIGLAEAAHSHAEHDRPVWRSGRVARTAAANGLQVNVNRVK
jgi:hypothetical protein